MFPGGSCCIAVLKGKLIVTALRIRPGRSVAGLTRHFQSVTCLHVPCRNNVSSKRIAQNKRKSSPCSQQAFTDILHCMLGCLLILVAKVTVSHYAAVHSQKQVLLCKL